MARMKNPSRRSRPLPRPTTSSSRSNEPVSARMGLAGTVADVSKAFGVTLFDYAHPKLGDFHARTGPVHVPPEVADAITGVFGSQQPPRDASRLQRRSHIGAPEMAKPAARLVRPDRARRHLQLPERERRASNASACSSSAAAWRPATSPAISARSASAGAQRAGRRGRRRFDRSGRRPGLDRRSHARRRRCRARWPPAPRSSPISRPSTRRGWSTCWAKVVSDSDNDPSVVSISWGWDENETFNNSGVIWSPAAIDHCNQSFLAAAHLGITVCVSTGDDGSEAQMQDGRAHVNFPATSPYVLAVGGTTLHVRKNRQRQPRRSPRRCGTMGRGGGTGGGVSDITPVPDLAERQGGAASINPGHFAGRAIPGRRGRRRSRDRLSDHVGRQARGSSAAPAPRRRCGRA